MFKFYKILMFAGLSVLAGAVARAAWAQPHGGFEALPMVARALVVAHRGCHAPSPRRGVGGAPENSLLALENCIAIGADMMETDIRRSKDGVLVIMHDPDVDRTTDGHGLVADLTAAQLSHLHLRQGFGGPDAPLTGQTVPTLEALLRAAKGRLAINLDIKAPIYEETVAMVANLGLLNQVLVKIAVEPSDPAFGAMEPDKRTWFQPIIDQRDAKITAANLPALILRQARGDDGARLANVRNIELVYQTDAFFDIARDAAEAQGLRVWINTLGPEFAGGRWDKGAAENPDAVWGWLIRQGVGIIQTDRPADLLDYIADPKHRPEAASNARAEKTPG
jgi:glycerophosphoryl diester phosphodiesterase